jgi:hypothetical protein
MPIVFEGTASAYNQPMFEDRGSASRIPVASNGAWWERLPNHIEDITPTELREFADLTLRLASKVDVLIEFFAVQDNWDGYGTPAPTKNAVAVALDFLVRLFSWKVLPNHIGLSPDGGVMFEFQIGDRYVMIDIGNDGGVVYLRRRGSEPAIADEVELRDLQAIAFKIAFAC